MPISFASCSFLFIMVWLVPVYLIATTDNFPHRLQVTRSIVVEQKSEPPSNSSSKPTYTHSPRQTSSHKKAASKTFGSPRPSSLAGAQRKSPVAPSSPTFRDRAQQLRAAAELLASPIPPTLSLRSQAEAIASTPRRRRRSRGEAAECSESMEPKRAHRQP